MRFHVTYLDGSEADVVRTASALRAFERENEMSIAAAIGTGRSWWADELAYKSLRQTDGLDVPFDAWLDTVESITMGVSADRFEAVASVLGVHVQADPTGGVEKAASPASS